MNSNVGVKYLLLLVGDGQSMKYYIAAFLSFRDRSSNQAIARFMYRHSFLMVLCGFALILGFNAAIAMQLLTGIYILPVDIALFGLLLFFLLIGRRKITFSVANTINPRDIKVADLLQREISGARQITIPRAAHHPQMEQPGLLNEAVLGFLSTV